MKSILTFSLTLLAALGVSAQEVDKPAQQNQQSANQYQFQFTPQELQTSGSDYFGNDQAAAKPPAEAPFSQGYNIEGLLADVLSGQSTRVQTPIHPDSAILEFTDGFGSIPYHSVGMVFNPGEGLLDNLAADIPTLQYINSYNFDSVSIPYWYNRPIDSFTTRDTITRDTTAVDFLVDGNYQDSFTISYDTTFLYTENDTSVLNTQVTFFNNANQPLTATKDTSFFPAYNLYDTATNANRVDTERLAVDRKLSNNQRSITVIGRIEENTQEVVDTLVAQYYIVRQNYVAWVDPVPWNEADTPVTASVPSNNAIAEMANPDGEVRIPLRTEDEHNTGNTQQSESITLEPLLDVNRATEELGEPLSVAATLTFKPGYPVDGRDTIWTISDGSIDPKNNYLSTIRNRFTGQITNESYTNGLGILNSQRYGSPNLASFFEDNYFMFNAPPMENPTPNNNAVTAVYFPFTFYLSADETDNLDSNVNTGVEAITQSGGSLSTQIYPNPASAGDQIQAKLTATNNTRAEVRLFNTIGKVVENLGVYQVEGNATTTIQLNTAGLEPGIYFLNVKTPNGERTSKISVVR